MMHDVEKIKLIRKNMRKKRRQLSTYTLKKSEFRTLHRLVKLAEISHAKKIGIYLDAFGEIPTRSLIMTLFKLNKKVYLPCVMGQSKSLGWKRVTFNHLQSQRLTLHKLGMKQIEKGRFSLTQDLDTIIMPLVAFDLEGHRIGMGGGFYDRTLASHPHRPTRIGLAHDFQYSTQVINPQSWDQALHFVCTPKYLWRFKA